MPGAELSEIIFISAMMVLILIVCGVTVYSFFKTYAKEKREKAARSAAGKTSAKNQDQIDSHQESKI